MAGHSRSLSFGWERKSRHRRGTLLVPPHTLDLRKLNLGLALGADHIQRGENFLQVNLFAGGHETELLRDRQLTVPFDSNCKKNKNQYMQCRKTGITKSVPNGHETCKGRRMRIIVARSASYNYRTFSLGDSLVLLRLLLLGLKQFQPFLQHYLLGFAQFWNRSANCGPVRLRRQ